MKAILVIDCDKEELGEAVATITAKKNDITFFARGFIRPLPEKKKIKTYGRHDTKSIWHLAEHMVIVGYNECIDEITGENNESNISD